MVEQQLPFAKLDQAAKPLQSGIAVGGLAKIDEAKMVPIGLSCQE
jgi:hypothetical protein